MALGGHLSSGAVLNRWITSSTSSWTCGMWPQHLWPSRRDREDQARIEAREFLHSLWFEIQALAHPDWADLAQPLPAAQDLQRSLDRRARAQRPRARHRPAAFRHPQLLTLSIDSSPACAVSALPEGRTRHRPRRHQRDDGRQRRPPGRAHREYPARGPQRSDPIDYVDNAYRLCRTSLILTAVGTSGDHPLELD
jgi:hypothetical protein